MVFYPSEGVSAVQKLQMTSHDAPGAKVIGIRGNFDDAQRGVKAIFASPEAAVFMARARYALLLRQFDQYRAASAPDRLLRLGLARYAGCGALGPEGIMDVAVPTGNFGNILAAWYAKRMGLPIGRLICASNRNNVLADFFGKSRYDRNRPFYKTESPSMDILVSSNLERLVFHATGEDPGQDGGSHERTRRRRELLAVRGRGVGPSRISRRAGPTRTAAAAATRRLFEGSGYLVDPHTAVAVAVLDEDARGDRESPGRPS